MKDKTETVALKKKREYTAPKMELMIIGGAEVMMDVMDSEHDNGYGDWSDWSIRPKINFNNLDDYYRE